MPEPERAGFTFEHGEHIRMHVALDRQVMRARLQVLADGEHVDIVRTQVTHDLEDFRIGFAQPDHQSRLGRYLRIARLELLQKPQRMRVIPARSRLAVKARHRLEVVVHHVRRRGTKYLQRMLQPAAEIRHQHFDRRVRSLFTHGTDAIHKVLRAAILQVVPVHAGDHHVPQAQARDRFPKMARFFTVRRKRSAVTDVAERTAPGADVPEDHERGSALAKAFTDVRA